MASWFCLAKNHDDAAAFLSVQAAFNIKYYASGPSTMLLDGSILIDTINA